MTALAQDSPALPTQEMLGMKQKVSTTGDSTNRREMKLRLMETWVETLGREELLFVVLFMITDFTQLITDYGNTIFVMH